MEKTIVMINSSNFASTGNIMLGITEYARNVGYKVHTFSPPGHTQKKRIKGHTFIGSVLERRISEKINILTGFQGHLNYVGTKLFLKQLDLLKPDIIHFHNLHSNYINLKLLFSYIKKRNIKVIWTLHDCWSFTGQCPYFDIVACKKWINGCYQCPMYRKYPETIIDRSKQMYLKKKEWFTGVKNLVLVTPSEWLGNLVKQSFLKEYPVKVIFNGIDNKKFRPRKSDFRKKYKLENEFIILGVAFSWGIRKGQDRFEALAEQLDKNYQIVLVGIHKSQIKSEKIICIENTDNQEELAEIYSIADVFLNPTREDNFPTVNIESLACGTPVLSYGAGGSAEAFDETCGKIISDANLVTTLEQLREKNFSSLDCVARGKMFENNLRFKEYIDLYNENLS